MALTHLIGLRQYRSMDMARVERELSPPGFLRLAGHPLRWRLLSELARSDRMVHELTGLVGQPQNLVSYHLGKLRAGRLVSARRSSADGRDAYYTLDLTRLRALLAGTWTALHPRLSPALSPDDEAPQPGAGNVRVLFLCTGNSARSQMAEALAQARSGGTIDAFSAGSSPKALHPNAVRAMREQGIDIDGHRTKHLGEFAETRFDWVITLCDRVREVCPEFPGRPKAIHWSIPDPAAGGDDDEASYPAFQHTAAELDTRIGFLLAALGKPTTTGALEAQ
jgi:ArsR family transcriptional regulator, arsenate/arsenite/antimonite-responsive transcriptional repressor / arsenate reductase (thioredoxin)